MRTYQRREQEISLPSREEGILPYLSVRYSFPEPLCARFVGIFGEERAERLLDAFSVQPPLTIRVNTLKTDRDTLLAQLSSPETAPTASPLSPDGILLGSAAPLHDGIQKLWQE